MPIETPPATVTSAPVTGSDPSAQPTVSPIDLSDIGQLLAQSLLGGPTTGLGTDADTSTVLTLAPAPAPSIVAEPVPGIEHRAPIVIAPPSDVAVRPVVTLPASPPPPPPPFAPLPPLPPLPSSTLPLVPAPLAPAPVPAAVLERDVPARYDPAPHDPALYDPAVYDPALYDIAVEDREHHVSWRRILLEWTVVILGAFAVFAVINTVCIQAFKIPSESMVPTLEIGDRVLVNKLSYDFHDVNRGDVIVFERPANAVKTNQDDPDDLIKRVIGLPGDRIVAREGNVFVNDRRLIEPYLPAGTTTDNLDTEITVPPGKVFVMGDNRSNSSDSRYIGPIDGDLVVGRAFAKVWPLSRAGSL